MDKSFCNKTEANLHNQSLGSLRFKVKKFWWTFIFPTNSPYYIRQSFVIFVNFDQNHHSTSTKKNQFSIFEKKWNSWTSFSTNFRKFMAVYQGNFDQKKRRIYEMILCFLKWYCVFFFNFKSRLIIDKKKRRISLFKTQYHFFSRFLLANFGIKRRYQTMGLTRGVPKGSSPLGDKRYFF